MQKTDNERYCDTNFFISLNSSKSKIKIELPCSLAYAKNLPSELQARHPPGI